MKTLIVHPQDPSTDFLKAVYDGLPNLTVISGGTKEGIKELLHGHDRMIALGHGTREGLLSVGQFNGIHAIDAETLMCLFGRKQDIFIWCNADQFVQRWNLRSPLYSGMFISEVGEAYMMGINTATKHHVDESNKRFAGILNRGLIKHWEEWGSDLMTGVEAAYYDSRNPVIVFNAERLYKTTWHLK